MTNEHYPEIMSAAVLTIVAVLLLNPFDIWMPNMAHMAMLAAAIVAFGAFAAFVLREGIGDERENVHRMFAGRVAFLAGSGILLFAIIFQSLKESLDPWLVVGLLVMILAKVGARLYSSRYR